MGGYGSGAYGWLGTRTAKMAVEQCRSIDIRRWQREDLLHRSFTWQWLNDKGEQVASIGVYGYEDVILLKYKADDEPIETEIPLDETPNGYGRRKWFLCPSCFRRCAILYLKGKYFKCRICHNLNYRSSQIKGDKIAEIDQKLNKLVRRLGGTSYKPGMFPPPRPKGMHQSTYDRLLSRFRWLEMKRHEAFGEEMRNLVKRIGSGEKAV